MDYIPKKDAELVTWSSNFASIIANRTTAWDIPVAEANALQTAAAEFFSLYEQAVGPTSNKVIVELKNEARTELKEKIRAMVNFRLQNPVITDAEKLELGLHLKDKTPTSIPVPVTRPEFNIKTADIRELTVIFRDQDSESKARPYGINGAVVAWTISDVPPASPDDLTHTALATRSPHLLQFTEENRGKTVYIALCWQNEKGQRGHWSEMQNAVIP
jgi:phosphoribosylformylglycinamidine (FGAM) synthase PurS component